MENLEILKGVVSDETFAKLEEETKDSTIKLGDLSTGKYVSDEKYKGLESQLQKLNSALNAKTAEYDALKEKAGDNQSLKDEIESLKTAHSDELESLKNSYESQLKHSAIAAEITANYKPKDIKDIMPYVDESQITVDGDSIVGLKEQLDPLKESKSYLFEEDKPMSRSGLNHNDKDDFDSQRLREAFGLKNKKE